MSASDDRSESTFQPIEIGPWAIKQELARGGNGIVYRATHRPTDIPAAVKMMTWTKASRPEHRQRFEDEVRSTVRLTHPGIIDIYDYGELDNWSLRAGQTDIPPSGPFLVMELARHGPLHRHFDSLNWPICRAIIADILDSLAHAHARGVIHRDLKPANILFGHDGSQRLRVKLSDFGLAFAFETATDSDIEALTGGTPVYMAPEQFRSNWRDYGPWTDLYGLGCVVWELLCGHPPFQEGSTLELAVQHTRKELPEFTSRIDVPDGTEAWLRKMLAKEPTERFQYAADALRHLPSTGSAEERIGLRQLEMSDADSNPSFDSATTEYPTLGSLALQPSDAPAPPLDRNAARPSDDDVSSDTSSDERTGGPEVDIPQDWRPPEFSDDLPPARRYQLTEVGLQLVSLRDLPMVARGAERDKIWEAVRETLANQARTRIILTGAFGIGKSRLARWARERTRELGLAQGLRVEWPATDADAKGAGLKRMLRDIFSIDGTDSEAAAERIERWFDRHPAPGSGEGATQPPLLRQSPSGQQPDRTPLSHVAAAVINWLIVDPPIRYRRIKLRNPAQRAAIAARLIERMAARRPVVLQIDDPHGPEAHALLRELRTVQQPLLTIVTADTDRLVADSKLDERLRSNADTIIELPPLKDQHLDFLVSRLLSVSPVLADKIIRSSNGNPRLAIETIRSLAGNDQLRPGPDGFELSESAGITVPEGMSDTVRTRLEPCLDEATGVAKHGLELGAVGGERIPEPQWRAACERLDIPFPRELIDRLERERLLVRNDEVIQFADAVARQLLVERAREDNRLTDYHSVWADVLREYDSEPIRVADHLVEAGRPREALQPLVNAMNLARWEYNHKTAQRCLYELDEILVDIELPDDHPVMIQYHLAKARDALQNHRADQQTTDHVQRALQGARALESDELTAEALVCRCSVATTVDGLDVGYESDLHEALALLSPREHPDRWARSVTALADHQMFDCGRTEDGLETIQRHIEDVDRLPARQSASLHINYARARFHVGDHDEALDIARKARAIANKNDLPRTKLPCFNIAATIHRERGGLDQAENLIRKALNLARIEPRVTTSTFELTLSDILMAAGRTREAYEHLIQLPTITKEQIQDHYPHAFNMLAATAACRLQRWNKATEFIRELAAPKATFDALTPEKERMMRDLLEAADQHPDSDLISSLRERFHRTNANLTPPSKR